MRKPFVAWTAGLLSWLVPAIAWAGDSDSASEIGKRGITGLSVLANISYAGMRAQNHPSRGWRIAAFIFGFPGTLLSFFFVAEGGNRAYGISFPPSLPRV
jgi:hypothetical protein